MSLGVAALLAFIGSMAAGIYVLAPRRDLVFSLSGPRLYERLYDIRHDQAEVHRRMVYDLHRFWQSNNGTIQRLVTAYRGTALSLLVEIILLVALLGGTIL